jgi:hypothetical protein
MWISYTVLSIQIISFFWTWTVHVMIHEQFMNSGPLPECPDHIFCLLLIDKARVNDKTYIWLSWGVSRNFFFWISTTLSTVLTFLRISDRLTYFWQINLRISGGKKVNLSEIRSHDFRNEK